MSEKINVKTIREQYAKRNSSDVNFTLKIGFRVANEEMLMGELDTYKDRVIAFEAVRSSEISSRLAERQPLQPSNHQVARKAPMVKAEGPAVSGSKAVFVPTVNSYLTQGRSQDENAVPVRDSNPYLPSQYQDPKFKARNQSILGRMQSPRPGVRSPSSPTQPSSTKIGARSITPGSTNITPASTYDTSRVPQSFSPLEDKTSQKMLESQRDAKRLSSLRDTRVALEAKAREDENSRTEPAAPKPELNLEERRPVEEVPMYSAETESPAQQFFQLQSLLKDAPPDMLERGVEQGVKLLEELRKPLLDKVEGSPDAAQWIQQIGKSQR